jgi:hypothetical protein
MSEKKDEHSLPEKARKSKKHEEIEGVSYSRHALDKLVERGIPLASVESAIKYGEKYEISDETKERYNNNCATAVYIERGVADKMPGKVGERIITVKPRKKEEKYYMAVLVLVDDEGVVRTIKVSSEKDTNDFIKKQCKKK